MATGKKEVAKASKNYTSNRKEQEGVAKGMTPPPGNLPVRGTRSNNASLGIDSDTVMGISNAVSPSGTSGTTTNTGMKQRAVSLDDNYGPQKVSGRIGTVGSREAMTVGPKANRGEFGTSALSGGHKEGSTMETLGAGSRAKGTASMETGIPGQSGSMAQARKGLRSGGDGQTSASQPTGAMNKSMAKARGALKQSGSGDE